jgi:putative endonuclease
MARTDLQQKGQQGEDDALEHLQAHGLVLIERNFLCKGGELDLIMRDGAHLVFIEVRRRRSRAFGGAAASITPAKQRRMKIAAQVFLLRYRRLPPCRFDVVAIDGDSLQWLKNVLD